MKAYIEVREANFRKEKAFLESKGDEVNRSYFGSEDGEAILYRKRRQGLALLVSPRLALLVKIEDVEGYVKEEMGEI